MPEESDKERRRRELRDKLDQYMRALQEMQKPSALDLRMAISDNNLDAARRLLDAGVDPNARERHEGSLLQWALQLGRAEIAVLLRGRGAVYGFLEAATAGDTTHIARLLDAPSNSPAPLVAALQKAVRKGRTEAVRLLLERGGAPPDACGDNQHTVLAEACTLGFPQIADLLVAAGATVGIVEAAYLGDLPLLQRFLAEGGNIDIENAAQVTPLMAACTCGHLEVARFLLAQGASPDRENERGQRPLTCAASHERIPLIHLLIDHGADPNKASSKFGSTPLENAANFGQAATAEALLARGANPNCTGRIGRTPLHHCAAHARWPLARPGVMTRIAVLLLGAGANIEAWDDLHQTPLMTAAYDGDPAMIRLLLERGADVRASDPESHFTALSQVRRRDKLHDKTEACTLIMRALGPEYAVYDAAERGDVSALVALLDAGAPADQGIVFNTRLLDSPHFTAETLAESPIAAAAGEGHTEVVRLLLQRGVSQLSKNNALFAAECEKHDETARLLREAGAVHKHRKKQSPA